MTKEQIEQLAAASDPLDGLRVRDVVVGDEHSLYVTLYSGGLPQTFPAPAEVWTCYKPGAVQLGEKAARRLLMEALCRYINTGADLEDLDQVVGGFVRVTRELEGHVNTDTLRLLDSGLNDHAAYEHLFAAADGSPWGLRWVEGEYVEAVSLSAVARELTDREDDHGPLAPPAAGG